MGLESIGELAECMSDLGINPTEQLTKNVDAKFLNASGSTCGNIEVIFNSNWHSADGPFIEFDETIRGFGIHHLQFKPKWLNMNYDKKIKRLTVSSDEYEFTLEF